MANCTDTIVTDNLDFCFDDENSAGISPVEIYAAPVADFDTIIAPPKKSVATSLEEAGTITGPHTFTAPKGFFKINILPDTGEVTTTGEGDKGMRTNRNAFAGTLYGNSAKVKGFIRKYQNTGMIFLVTDLNGVIHQIGSEISPAYLSENNHTTGLKSGDVSGVPVKFEDTQAYPAPVYTGAITEFTPA